MSSSDSSDSDDPNATGDMSSATRDIIEDTFVYVSNACAMLLFIVVLFVITKRNIHAVKGRFRMMLALGFTFVSQFILNAVLVRLDDDYSCALNSIIVHSSLPIVSTLYELMVCVLWFRFEHADERQQWFEHQPRNKQTKRTKATAKDAKEEAAIEMMDETQKKNASSSSSSDLWFHNHLWMISGKVLLPVGVLLVAVQWTLAVLFDLVMGNNCDHGTVNPFALGSGILMSLVMITMTAKMKGRFDNLGLKKELTLVSQVFVLGYTGTAVAQQLANKAKVNDPHYDFERSIAFWCGHILKFLMLIAFSIISIVSPLLRARNSQTFRTVIGTKYTTVAGHVDGGGGGTHQAAGAAATKTNQVAPMMKTDVDIKEFLQDEKRREEFRSFLYADFSQQNLLFVIQVEKWTESVKAEKAADRSNEDRVHSIKALIQQALLIEKNFLSENAVMQVMLPSDRSKQIHEQMQDLVQLLQTTTTDMDSLKTYSAGFLPWTEAQFAFQLLSKTLKKATDDVYAEMQNDSFPRFIFKRTRNPFKKWRFAK